MAEPQFLKGNWSPAEDEDLKRSVEVWGCEPHSWRSVADEFNKSRPRNIQRSMKQCRERYLLHLKPDISNEPWTQAEDELIVAGHKQYGNKWQEISKMLPGRTESSVKNRWNATMRRKYKAGDPAEEAPLRKYIRSLMAEKEGEEGNQMWGTKRARSTSARATYTTTMMTGIPGFAPPGTLQTFTPGLAGTTIAIPGFAAPAQLTPNMLQGFTIGGMGLNNLGTMNTMGNLATLNNINFQAQRSNNVPPVSKQQLYSTPFMLQDPTGAGNTGVVTFQQQIQNMSQQLATPGLPPGMQLSTSTALSPNSVMQQQMAVQQAGMDQQAAGMQAMQAMPTMQQGSQSQLQLPANLPMALPNMQQGGLPTLAQPGGSMTSLMQDGTGVATMQPAGMQAMTPGGVSQLQQLSQQAQQNTMQNAGQQQQGMQSPGQAALPTLANGLPPVSTSQVAGGGVTPGMVQQGYDNSMQHQQQMQQQQQQGMQQAQQPIQGLPPLSTPQQQGDAGMQGMQTIQQAGQFIGQPGQMVQYVTMPVQGNAGGQLTYVRMSANGTPVQEYATPGQEYQQQPQQQPQQAVQHTSLMQLTMTAAQLQQQQQQQQAQQVFDQQQQQHMQAGMMQGQVLPDGTFQPIATFSGGYTQMMDQNQQLQQLQALQQQQQQLFDHQQQHLQQQQYLQQQQQILAQQQGIIDAQNQQIAQMQIQAGNPSIQYPAGYQGQPGIQQQPAGMPASVVNPFATAAAGGTYTADKLEIAALDISSINKTADAAQQPPPGPLGQQVPIGNAEMLQQHASQQQQQVGLAPLTSHHGDETLNPSHGPTPEGSQSQVIMNSVVIQQQPPPPPIQQPPPPQQQLGGDVGGVNQQEQGQDQGTKLEADEELPDEEDGAEHAVAFRPDEQEETAGSGNQQHIVKVDPNAVPPTDAAQQLGFQQAEGQDGQGLARRESHTSKQSGSDGDRQASISARPGGLAQNEGESGDGQRADDGSQPMATDPERSVMSGAEGAVASMNDGVASGRNTPVSAIKQARKKSRLAHVAGAQGWQPADPLIVHMPGPVQTKPGAQTGAMQVPGQPAMPGVPGTSAPVMTAPAGGTGWTNAPPYMGLPPVQVSTRKRSRPTGSGKGKSSQQDDDSGSDHDTEGVAQSDAEPGNAEDESQPQGSSQRKPRVPHIPPATAAAPPANIKTVEGKGEEGVETKASAGNAPVAPSAAQDDKDADQDETMEDEEQDEEVERSEAQRKAARTQREIRRLQPRASGSRGGKEGAATPTRRSKRRNARNANDSDDGDYVPPGGRRRSPGKGGKKGKAGDPGMDENDLFGIGTLLAAAEAIDAEEISAKQTVCGPDDRPSRKKKAEPEPSQDDDDEDDDEDPEDQDPEEEETKNTAAGDPKEQTELKQQQEEGEQHQKPAEQDAEHPNDQQPQIKTDTQTKLGGLPQAQFLAHPPTYIACRKSKGPSTAHRAIALAQEGNDTDGNHTDSGMYGFSDHEEFEEQDDALTGRNSGSTLGGVAGPQHSNGSLNRVVRKPSGGQKAKLAWSKAESELLCRFVEEFGGSANTTPWTTVAQKLNDAMRDRSLKQGTPWYPRTSKQCRERWIHNLAPNICKEAWTEEEDLILAQAHQQFGNQWSRVAKLLPGRSENIVKNKFNATLRRKQPARMPDGAYSPLDVYMVYKNLKSYDPQTNADVLSQTETIARLHQPITTLPPTASGQLMSDTPPPLMMTSRPVQITTGIGLVAQAGGGLQANTLAMPMTVSISPEPQGDMMGLAHSPHRLAQAQTMQARLTHPAPMQSVNAPVVSKLVTTSSSTLAIGKPVQLGGNANGAPGNALQTGDHAQGVFTSMPNALQGAVHLPDGSIQMGTQPHQVAATAMIVGLPPLSGTQQQQLLMHAPNINEDGGGHNAISDVHSSASDTSGTLAIRMASNAGDQQQHLLQQQHVQQQQLLQQQGMAGQDQLMMINAMGGMQMLTTTGQQLQMNGMQMPMAIDGSQGSVVLMTGMDGTPMPVMMMTTATGQQVFAQPTQATMAMLQQQQQQHELQQAQALMYDQMTGRVQMSEPISHSIGTGMQNTSAGGSNTIIGNAAVAAVMSVPGSTAGDVTMMQTMPQGQYMVMQTQPHGDTHATMGDGSATVEAGSGVAAAQPMDVDMGHAVAQENAGVMVPGPGADIQAQQELATTADVGVEGDIHVGNMQHAVVSHVDAAAAAPVLAE